MRAALRDARHRPAGDPQARVSALDVETLRRDLRLEGGCGGVLRPDAGRRRAGRPALPRSLTPWRARGHPATRAARPSRKVAFTLHEYHVDPRAASYGKGAAAALGVDAGTRVQDARRRGRRPAHRRRGAGDRRRSSLKALAAAVGGKRAAMAEPAAAERATGYVTGGISPFGQRTRLPVVVDASALDWPTVYVSAGRRGLQVEVAPADLIAMTGAATATIAQTSLTRLPWRRGRAGRRTNDRERTLEALRDHTAAGRLTPRRVRRAGGHASTPHARSSELAAHHGRPARRESIHRTRDTWRSRSWSRSSSSRCSALCTRCSPESARPAPCQDRHSAAYAPPAATSSSWLPSSVIRPSSTTATRSASWAEKSRCAIATTVRPSAPRPASVPGAGPPAGRAARWPRPAPACAGRPAPAGRARAAAPGPARAAAPPAPTPVSSPSGRASDPVQRVDRGQRGTHLLVGRRPGGPAPGCPGACRGTRGAPG